MATVNAATVPSADDDALFLGLDFGTSGARATVVGPDGVILCETTAKYPPIVNGGKAGDGIPEGGWAEAWRGALWSLLDQLDETTVRSRIAAVSIDGTSGTVLIVDAASGEPIYPPMLYNEKRNDAMDAVCAMAPTGHTVRTPSSALCKLHSWWLGNGGNDRERQIVTSRRLDRVSTPRIARRDGPQQRAETRVRPGLGPTRGLPGMDEVAAVRVHAALERARAGD